jgi:hypothetical protein
MNGRSGLAPSASAWLKCIELNWRGEQGDTNPRWGCSRGVFGATPEAGLVGGSRGFRSKLLRLDSSKTKNYGKRAHFDAGACMLKCAPSE